MSESYQNLLKRKRSSSSMAEPVNAPSVDQPALPTMSDSPQPPSRHTPTRRRFEELHPRDRQTKANRRSRIETNWGTDIQECIPIKIRPRVELKKGAKIRVGDINGSEEIWWNWSVEVLRGLEELSTMMAGKLPVAMELMTLEVQKRQRDPKNPQRRVAELLLGDVQRVCDNVRRHQANQVTDGTEEDIEMATLMQLVREPQPDTKEDVDDKSRAGSPTASENGLFVNQMSTPTPSTGHHNMLASQQRSGHASMSALAPTPGHSYTNGHQNQPNGAMTAAPPLSSPSMNTHVSMLSMLRSQNITNFEVKIQADVTEMRGRAIRLRAQAIRLEAEATQLESDAAVLRQNLARE